MWITEQFIHFEIGINFLNLYAGYLPARDKSDFNRSLKVPCYLCTKHIDLQPFAAQIVLSINIYFIDNDNKAELYIWV